jgi:hypothetical protein
MKKIAITMITKNEQDNIEECLSAAVGFCEALGAVPVLCIDDTGSYDMTVSLIESFMLTTGTDGDIKSVGWEHFAANRNRVAERARQMEGVTHMLFLDADDRIRWSVRGLAPQWAAFDAVYLPHVSAEYQWLKPVLVSTQAQCEWDGVLHEALVLPASTYTNRLTEAWVSAGVSRSVRDTARHEKDARGLARLADITTDQKKALRYQILCGKAWLEAGNTFRAFNRCRKVMRTPGAGSTLLREARIFAARCLIRENKLFAASQMLSEAVEVSGAGDLEAWYLLSGLSAYMTAVQLDQMQTLLEDGSRPLVYSGMLGLTSVAALDWYAPGYRADRLAKSVPVRDSRRVQPY